MTSALATKSAQTDLAAAIKKNDVTAMKELLQQGADINEEINGDSPLMLATACGHVDIVQLLIDRGADVNKRAETRNGRTPLIEAAYKNNIKLVSLLADAGADIGAKDEDGATALMHASANVNIKIMNLLIDAGANVNARARNGETAFSIAEEKNRRALAREIILSMAEEYCHEEMMRLLKEARTGQRQAQKTRALQKRFHAVAVKKQQRLNTRTKHFIIRRPQS